MADDLLTPEDEQDLRRQRQKLYNQRLRSRMQESEPVTVWEEDGGFRNEFPEPLYDSQENPEVAIDDGKGNPKRVSLLHAMANRKPAFDYTQLRQDFNDAGMNTREPMDPIIAKNLNTVQFLEGNYYDIDGQGKMRKLLSQQQAMELVNSGQRKAGNNVVSAKKVAQGRQGQSWVDSDPTPVESFSDQEDWNELNKMPADFSPSKFMRPQEEEINIEEEYPMPTLDKKNKTVVSKRGNG